MMRFILNVFWWTFGGLWMVLGWWFAGILMAISIIGLPWARACFVIGLFSLWPFGKEAVNRNTITGVEDFGTGILGCLGNVIWFVFAGWWLAIAHVFFALTSIITVIGTPFGIQHLKLARISLSPIGKMIVDKH